MREVTQAGDAPNPYADSVGRGHQLDMDLMRERCFEIFNLIVANRALIEPLATDPDAEPEIFPSLLQLHSKLAGKRLSQKLLELAVYLRTYDDLQRQSDHDGKYKIHAEATSGIDFIGALDARDLDLREACNKLIHATEVRPHYDPVHQENGPLRVVAWYLSGEIDLCGTYQGKPWLAQLWVERFLETALDRLDFDRASPAG